jgi:uncharacterized protein (DUF169 family)
MPKLRAVSGALPYNEKMATVHRGNGRMTVAQDLVAALGLTTAPVGITFHTTPPAGVPQVAAPGPSSCTYWKRAAAGETFYTDAADHYQCPIGGYTHGVDMPAAQMQELQGVVSTMVSLGYLRMEEVPEIPRRTEPFGVAVYAPLDKCTTLPGVVLIAGNAAQIMLLEEAALAAGVGGGSALMGRPTCAALPQAMHTERGIASLGCIGNRVYTGITDDQLYYALPGKHLAAVVEKLAIIVTANRELEKYHRARMPALSA